MLASEILMVTDEKSDCIMGTDVKLMIYIKEANNDDKRMILLHHFHNFQHSLW